MIMMKMIGTNLRRTWYRTEEGKRYYENHYGYIDSKGKYIIPMKYEDIEKIGDNIWACYKNGEILVVETEKDD